MIDKIKTILVEIRRTVFILSVVILSALVALAWVVPQTIPFPWYFLLLVPLVFLVLLGYVKFMFKILSPIEKINKVIEAWMKDFRKLETEQ
jgi:membrane protein implicated in regulation of membrane protease activity